MDTQAASSELKYADISINLAAIDRSYHYAIPPELLGRLQPGCLVVVPFGKQIVQGVVLALLEKPEVENTLPILSLNSEETVLTPQQLQLAQWLARETFAPLGAAVNLMLPRGLSQRADILVERRSDQPAIPAGLTPLQTAARGADRPFPSKIGMARQFGPLAQSGIGAHQQRFSPSTGQPKSGAHGTAYHPAGGGCRSDPAGPQRAGGYRPSPPGSPQAACL